MKKLLLILLITAMAVVPLLLHRTSHQSTPVIRPTTTTIVKTTPEPSFHIGDNQVSGSESLALTTVYAPATPLTSMDEVDPGSILVAFRLIGNIGQTDLHKASLIYTSDNKYLKPLGGSVKECSDCVVFIMPKNVVADTFIYKNFKWYL